MLVNITAGSDMSIGEFEIVGDTIRDFTSEQATVVVGTVIEPDMQDEMKVTIVVTGLDEATDALDSGPVRKNFRDKLTSMQDRLGGGDSRSSLAGGGKDWGKVERVAGHSRASAAESKAKQETASSAAESSVPAQDNSRVIDIPAFLRRQEVDETEEA